MRVFVTSKSFGRADDGAAQRFLESRGFEIEYCSVRNPAAEVIAGEVGDADVLMVGNDPVTAQVLAEASNLRLVIMHGTGLDAIDIKHATERGVLVANVPGVNRNSVAELIVALMLNSGRQIPAHIERLQAGEWGRRAGHEVSGAVVALVGLGNIGQRVVELLDGFKCQLLAYEPWPDREWAAEHGVRLHDDLKTLLSLADYVVLTVPLTEQTRNLLDAERLAWLKPNAVVVNAARGGLVDEDALADAVRSGAIWGAALDVYNEEPPAPNSPLVGSGIILTPHMAATSLESTARVSMAVAERIVEITLNNRPELAVNADLLDNARLSGNGERRESR